MRGWLRYRWARLGQRERGFLSDVYDTLATGALVFLSATLVRATTRVARTRLLSRLVTVAFAMQFAVGYTFR